MTSWRIAALLLIFACACGADDPSDTPDSGAPDSSPWLDGSTADAPPGDASAPDVSADGSPDAAKLDASSQVGIIFAADFSASKFPLYGFSFEAITAGYSTRHAVPGAGPGGRDACQYDMTVNPANAQPYLGWKREGLPQTNQGQTRYIRLLMKTLAPCNPIGTSDVWADKLIILGDGSGPFSRVIGFYGDANTPYPPASATRIKLGAMAKGIGGFPSESCAASNVTIGDWHWVQWEIRSSSTTTASDAQIKVWVDSGTYATPTSQSNPMNLRTAAYQDDGGFVSTNGWSNVGLGFYAGTSLASGQLSFQFAGFEYADAFDPNWHP